MAFILRQSGNWADEFDINGFKIVETAKEVDDTIAAYNFLQEFYPYYEFYYGTNEFVYAESIDELTFSAISDEEAKTIRTYVGNELGFLDPLSAVKGILESNYSIDEMEKDIVGFGYHKDDNDPLFFLDKCFNLNSEYYSPYDERERERLLSSHGVSMEDVVRLQTEYFEEKRRELFDAIKELSECLGVTPQTYDSETKTIKSLTREEFNARLEKKLSKPVFEPKKEIKSTEDAVASIEETLNKYFHLD